MTWNARICILRVDLSQQWLFVFIVSRSFSVCLRNNLALDVNEQRRNILWKAGNRNVIELTLSCLHCSSNKIVLLNFTFNHRTLRLPLYPSIFFFIWLSWVRHMSRHARRFSKSSKGHISSSCFAMLSTTLGVPKTGVGPIVAQTAFMVFEYRSL